MTRRPKNPAIQGFVKDGHHHPSPNLVPIQQRQTQHYPCSPRLSVEDGRMAHPYAQRHATMTSLSQVLNAPSAPNPNTAGPSNVHFRDGPAPLESQPPMHGSRSRPHPYANITLPPLSSLLDPHVDIAAMDSPIGHTVPFAPDRRLSDTRYEWRNTVPESPDHDKLPLILTTGPCRSDKRNFTRKSVLPYHTRSSSSDSATSADAERSARASSPESSGSRCPESHRGGQSETVRLGHNEKERERRDEHDEILREAEAAAMETLGWAGEKRQRKQYVGNNKRDGQGPRQTRLIFDKGDVLKLLTLFPGLFAFLSSLFLTVEQQKGIGARGLLKPDSSHAELLSFFISCAKENGDDQALSLLLRGRKVEKYLR